MDTKSRNYSFVVQPDGDQWFIFYPDLPGVMTQAETWDEIGAMAQDALEGWIESQVEDHRPIPEPRFEMNPDWDYRTVGDDWLTTDDVAAELGVSQRRVLQLADSRGTGKKFGKSVMFRPSEIEDMRPKAVGRPRKNESVAQR